MIISVYIYLGKFNSSMINCQSRLYRDADSFAYLNPDGFERLNTADLTAFEHD